MSRPLVVNDEREAQGSPPDKRWDNIVALRAHSESINEGLNSVQAAVGVLKDFRYGASHRDNKKLDYLLIALLSLGVHQVVVEQLRNMPLAKEELAERVKPQSKVQISFTQPKPKPVVVPPPPKQVVKEPPPPPKPNVVPLKKPPKPKVPPKPVLRAEPPPVDIPDRVERVEQSAPVQEPVKAAPPPPPPPKVVEKVTQPSAGAGYLNNPAPNYPDEATERGWEGKVLMKVHVLANGKPDGVTVVKSSGHEILDDEAVRTVKRWEFVPGKRGDTPIDGYVTVPISFNLAN